MDVIIPIRPRHANGIMLGSKKFELRMKVPTKKCTHLLIYATAPISQVVARAKIERVHHLDIEQLWNKVRTACGVTMEEFYAYHRGLEKGHALELGYVEVYRPHRPLTDYGITAPPQNFCYYDSKEN